MNRLKIIGVLLFAVMLPAFPAMANEAIAPDLIVAKFHADWSDSSKALAQTLNGVRTQYSGRNVLFVTFDLTDKRTIHQSGLLARSMRLSKVFESHDKAGMALLINPRSRRVLGKITKDHSFESMVDMIEATSKGRNLMKKSRKSSSHKTNQMTGSTKSDKKTSLSEPARSPKSKPKAIGF